jgi:transposase
MVEFMGNRGLSARAAALHADAPYKIAKSTLDRWWRHFVFWGEPPSATAKRLVRKGVTRISKGHVTYIHGLVRADPGLYLDQVRDAVTSRFNTRYACSTIHRLLHEVLGLTLQVRKRMAVQASVQEQRIYRESLSTVADPRMLVFVDESAVGEKSARRRRGWAVRGGHHTPILYEVFDDFDAELGRTTRYTLIGAANMDGFMLKGCDIVHRRKNKNGPRHQGSVDSERFFQYVKECLKPQLGRYKYNEPNSVVVMDNASIHKDPRIVQLIEERDEFGVIHGARIIWTAAYSPWLNPIEYMFHQYKAWLKRNRWEFSRDPVGTHLASLAYSVSRDDMIHYYTSEQMEDCIRNVPLDSVAQQLVDEQTALAAAGLAVFGEALFFLFA